MKKALIVDDNEQNLYLLQTMLKGRGYDVLTAANGVEALEQARRDPPDVVISDILMPVMDGFTLCREWKKDKRLQQIPFVFSTATYTDHRDEELALRLGAARFIVMPQEPEAFAALLKQVIEEPKACPSLAPAQVAPEETDYYQLYSEVLIRKLEDKLLQLEEANKRLKQETTERMQTEEKLREAEERYRMLFTQAGEGVFVLSGDGTLVEVNESFARMHGYGAREMLRMSLADFITPETAQSAPERMRRLLAGEALTFDVEHIHKNGHAFPLEVSANLLSYGGKSYIQCFHRDITERRKLEEQLRQAQKMESIGQLAGGIAHDFNNILATIMGYGEMALMSMQADDPQRLNIEHVLEATDKAVHLTKDLLLFSRKQTAEKKPADLCMILRNVGNILTRVLGEDVAFKSVAPSGGMPIFADKNQIEQVLMNLATNARDAMPRGGAFTITLEELALDDEFVALHGYGKTGKYAMITAADTGSGMDEQTRQRIFEPFFTTKEVGKGTGLGMAVVYGIVKQHGGYINAYSEPGKGTTFRIYLPQVSSATRQVERAEDSIHPDRGSGVETILLAEDDAALREMTATVLEEFGYRVITAVDGEDAVKKFREHKDRIRLLLLDLIMPKKNGKEAYDEIVAIKPGCKTIFLSGYTPDMIRQRISIEEGIPVISKPISPRALLKEVRAVLDA